MRSGTRDVPPIDDTLRWVVVGFRLLSTVWMGALVGATLADDHDLFRAGVRAAISGEVDIVGEADDVDPAVELIRERVPDVVLLDVHLPGGGGHRVAREVGRTHPASASWPSRSPTPPKTW